MPLVHKTAAFILLSTVFSRLLEALHPTRKPNIHSYKPRTSKPHTRKPRTLIPSVSLPTKKPNIHSYKPRTRKPSLIAPSVTLPVFPTGVPSLTPFGIVQFTKEATKLPLVPSTASPSHPTATPTTAAPQTWTPTFTHYPTTSLFPTRYRTRIPSTTASPSRPTLYPTPGTGQSGGGASNGLLSNGKANAVDVILIVFFGVFGVALIAACVFITAERLQKGRRLSQRDQGSQNPMAEQHVTYQEQQQ